MVDAGSHATLWILSPPAWAAFLCWFIGETVLYSCLFSYFHAPTGAFELFPTMATVYFIQVVNCMLQAAHLCFFCMPASTHPG